MDRFRALEPTRLYSSTASGSLLPSRSQPIKLHQSSRIGYLPADLHILILSFLPIPDFPAYTRCSRSTAAISQDEKLWEGRLNALKIDKYRLDAVIDSLEDKSRNQPTAQQAATLTVDDDFGDFASVDIVAAPPGEMADFVGAFDNVSVAPATPMYTRKATSLGKFIRIHNLLKPLARFLSSPPHIILTDLAAYLSSTLRQEAMLLHLLSLYLSPTVMPVRNWVLLYSSLRSAMDRFEANLLAAFDIADGRSDEVGMREAAESSWEVWDRTGDWEMGKVWAEKREIFYDQSNWNPMENFTKDEKLDFDPMDDFMNMVLGSIIEHGSRAVRVFPPQSDVLIFFSGRIASEVLGEYVESLLLRARELATPIYLTAVAATFREAFRMVDAILQAAKERTDSNVERTRAEDVIYQMFEINMDEYLDEEVEHARRVFENICKTWGKQASINGHPHGASGNTTRFLGSQNPALVKRNVLSSFASVLLVPVTIVPRAVGGALMTGGSAAVQGIAMLNPQRWGGSASAAPPPPQHATAATKEFLKETESIFEVGDDDENEDVVGSDGTKTLADSSTSLSNTLSTSTALTSTTSLADSKTPVSGMDLLLSLDVALELVHADREALKRVEIFSGYPGHYGHRVRDTIEELFILMLQSLGDRHMSPGFAHAIERMTSYKPADHEETMSVAPLLQFFELVHVGDTIQSMIQVYFDKELAPHIDKTDFLNAVMREKKRFENALDDSVASGLNAGTDVLMNQVEHIILKLTKPREYYPPEDKPMDLGPTEGCLEAIKCLEMHCKLLKGSTSREVLDVFHQEVGIRLIAILQKHIKRQIISLAGGFQVIADLNTYHSFIASLKVPSIASEFSHLKMLGHVYVVEDAKDLAQIVRDVTRYGGAYRPEDIYEFIQRRSDWKKIEKTVDKTMYNLSFKEDCVVC